MFSRDNGNIKPYIAWSAVCIIWGTTYLAIKIGVTDLPPMLFAGVRWIFAGLLLFTVLKMKGYTLPNMKEIKVLAVVGIALLGIANGLVVVAEQWLPSGLAALLLTTLPFWVVTIESLLPNGINFNIRISAGLLIGFLGILLIFLNDIKYLLEFSNFIGILCLLGAVISWASGSVYSSRRKIKVHPLMGAAFQMMIAGTAQTLLGVSLGEIEHFIFTPESFAAFAYLFIFGSFVGYGSYMYAIQYLPVSFVSTYAYINPIIALFLGWLVLDEDLNYLIGISAVLIILGVYLVKRGSEASPRSKSNIQSGRK